MHFYLLQNAIVNLPKDSTPYFKRSDDKASKQCLTIITWLDLEESTCKKKRILHSWPLCFDNKGHPIIRKIIIILLFRSANPASWSSEFNSTQVVIVVIIDGKVIPLSTPYQTYLPKRIFHYYNNLYYSPSKCKSQQKSHVCINNNNKNLYKARVIIINLQKTPFNKSCAAIKERQE